MRISTITVTGGVVCVLALVVYGIVALRSRIEADTQFAFAEDLVEFCQENHRPPHDWTEFGLWRTNSQGLPIWDIKKTERRYKLVTNGRSCDGEWCLIEARRLSLKKYEKALNQYIRSSLGTDFSPGEL